MLTVPPASLSISDRTKTKRDTGVLRCSVGVKGKSSEKQAGWWSESSPVRGKKISEHISSTVQNGDSDDTGGQYQKTTA